MFISKNICLCAPEGCPTNPNDPDCTVETDPCKDCGDCFKLLDSVLCSSYSVPCSGSGEFDLSPSTCSPDSDRPVTYQLVSCDDAFATADFNGDSGMLGFTFTNDAVPGNYYSIQYKATYFDESNNRLGAFGNVMIGVKDLCALTVPGEGQICDPCTGEVRDGDPAIVTTFETT